MSKERQEGPENREGEFKELLKYTVPGYIGGLTAGFALDQLGFQGNAVGQWFVRTVSGEGESIFEGFYAIRQRFTKAAGSMAEAYGWGKFLGMTAPWIIDAASRLAGVDVNGVQGFYIPYFYALSDQMGANISGLVYLKRREGQWGTALKEYIKDPVMLSSWGVIAAVPVGLLASRVAGFSPDTQTFTALETIAANLCWVPPLVGLFAERRKKK